jgi:vancomycin resistance protein YoaR
MKTKKIRRVSFSAGSRVKKHGKRAIKETSKVLKPFFWFAIGAIFALFCLATFLLIYFKVKYHSRIIPGVFVGKIYVGEKTAGEAKNIFEEKNKEIGGSKITFTLDDSIATISAQDLNIGYDSELISMQAERLGKSNDLFSNIYQIINSYFNGINLSPSYSGSTDSIVKLLSPMEKKIHKDPIDALFQVENNRVSAFKQSQEGLTIDFEKIEESVQENIPGIIGGKKSLTLRIPLKILEPEVTTEEANKFGIVEEIGYGSSKFAHSIPNRVYNVTLAASRLNGVLVAPGEEFSFAKYLGDVSKFTGYREAYVIQNGKTVLGDGGGVCQVSTTLFRAILNAGLPVTERHAHAYRVGYYEQDMEPGVDATVYVPSVDLKFLNDSENYILIQSYVDQVNMAMSFTFYGKKDGRIVSMTNPVVTDQSPAPESEYQDDPTLPAGTLKQVDYAAPGAKTSFTRTVTKDGKLIISETYKSTYTPWRAVFLRGTQQG